MTKSLFGLLGALLLMSLPAHGAGTGIAKVPLRAGDQSSVFGTKGGPQPFESVRILQTIAVPKNESKTLSTTFSKDGFGVACHMATETLTEYDRQISSGRVFGATSDQVDVIYFSDTAATATIRFGELRGDTYSYLQLNCELTDKSLEGSVQASVLSSITVRDLREAFKDWMDFAVTKHAATGGKELPEASLRDDLRDLEDLQSAPKAPAEAVASAEGDLNPRSAREGAGPTRNREAASNAAI